jgi:hypothetical protein
MLTLFALIIIASCSKNKDKEDEGVLINCGCSGNHASYWELKFISGGMMPTVTYPAGNGNILKFTSRTYEKYNDTTLVEKGTHRLVADGSVKENVCLEITPGRYRHRIIFNNDVAAQKTFINITDTTLSYISGCFALDGGVERTYRRIKKPANIKDKEIE